MSVVDVSRSGKTAVVRFDRPPANAIDLTAVEEIADCFAALEADPPAGGVVITGTGGVFSAGVDFKAAPAYSAEDKRRMIAGINTTVARLYALPTATVAAVNGHAMGGGLVLAVACDFRLFTDGKSKLGLTEVAVGIPYPACPMAVLKAELPMPLCRDLTLSGRVFGPGEAQAMGIADALCPPDALLERAVEMAARMAAQPSYVTVKRQLRGAAAAAMRRIVEQGTDPMLEHWM